MSGSFLERVRKQCRHLSILPSSRATVSENTLTKTVAVYIDGHISMDQYEGLNSWLVDNLPAHVTHEIIARFDPTRAELLEAERVAAELLADLPELPPGVAVDPPAPTPEELQDFIQDSLSERLSGFVGQQNVPSTREQLAKAVTDRLKTPLGTGKQWVSGTPWGPMGGDHVGAAPSMPFDSGAGVVTLQIEGATGMVPDPRVHPPSCRHHRTERRASIDDAASENGYFCLDCGSRVCIVCKCVIGQGLVCLMCEAMP